MSNTSRQLVAILFADIQGYTALMQRDEAKAIQLRDKFQKDLEREIKWRGGRIAVFSGDGALCVFKSAIEAVRAAIAVQDKMLEEPIVPLRIGIHTGDVVTEGKNVYGDGVNVASRLESFAVAGSVFISGKVADEIKNQPGIEIVPLGKFEFKNIHAPVEIFAIKNNKLIVPKKQELTGKGSRIGRKRYSPKRIWIGAVALLALLILSFFAYKKYSSPMAAANSAGPQLNTIAVLPFANLSGQKDDEYFADGMCDEILTQISKISAINVLSRTSTLQFRDTKKTMKEIGEQIGADVLLEGSVQKFKDQVRIIVKLINASSDKPLWAETYDRELKDVFFIQSDIAEQIAQALNATLTKREEELFSEKPTENLKAFDLYLRGNKYADGFWNNTKMEEIHDAIRMYEQAIALDPKFLEAYNGLIALYTEISWRKPVVNYEDYRIKAKEWLDKMIELKIDKPIVHAAIYIYKYEGERDYRGALIECDLIDKYYGNDKQTIDMRAYVLRRMGKIEEALSLFLRQARAYPKQAFLHSEIAGTYSLLRNADSAIYHSDKTIQLRPDNAGFYIEKAVHCINLNGDIPRAKEILKSGASFVDTTEFSDTRIYLDMLEGKYGSAILGLSNRADSMWDLSQSHVTTNAEAIAVMLNNDGNKENAKVYFRKSLDMVSRLVRLHPEDFRMHSALGIAYAGLGERERAITEGIKARDMMPVSTDAIIGIAPLQNLALIYTLLSDQDKAIDILEQLLKMPFGWDDSNNIPLYRTDPSWKLLQNNPRFKKLIQ
jgi:TolB-like protein/class 3 adenylate cyclase